MANGEIAKRLREIRASLRAETDLIAVSKFHPIEAIAEAYEAGQRDFGESRVQELMVKAPALPGDIRWHFIGHLQTNKVRQAVEFAQMIQSVDSLKLMNLIDREAGKIGKQVDILLQVHVAAEETKTGFLPDELKAAATEAMKLGHIRLRGVMGMATNTDDEARIRQDFHKIKECFDELSKIVSREDFDTISMGMSDDRDLALSEGSTMVRIGSDIFGNREY